MPFAPGSQIGAFEIRDLIGSGGMGEVYRARDSRLRRDVAIKVIPPGLANDPDRVRRFLLEARAAGALSHPNVCSILEVGTHDNAPFVVMELLGGETLRERLQRGPIPTRTAVEWAAQVARALVAAHMKGIVHRDLKPENLFITREGGIKVLDFGLAKLIAVDGMPAPGGGSIAATLTATGMILGTSGYMSPEQVTGNPADPRSDVFALGAVLYEMLARERAFPGDSFVEASHAILSDEPAPLAAPGRDVPEALEQIVRRCLAKRPEDRFQTASDLAFSLEALTEVRPLPARVERGRRLARAAGVVGLAAAAAAIAFLQGQERGHGTPPVYARLTYQRGRVGSARFASDGSTVVYSASWEGRPPEVFTTLVGGPETRPLGFGEAEVASVSGSGEVALLLHPRNAPDVFRTATLGTAALGGGTARELATGVLCADWAPDGKRMAIIRYTGRTCRLEFPIGNVLYEKATWLTHARVSPRGDRVAFIEHTGFGNDDGSIMIADGGRVHALAPGWTSAMGLAWSADGGEVWFTAESEVGRGRALYRATLGGRVRLVDRTPVSLDLCDLARDGRVLLAVNTTRFETMALAPGEARERNLTWLGFSWPRDISANGRTVLIEEQSAGMRGNGIWLRSSDGGAPVRLGEGSPRALSPDGAWVLASDSTRHFFLLPTSAGQPRAIANGGLIDEGAAQWLPDGKGFAYVASEPGRGPRTYIQEMNGPAAAVTPEGVRGTAVSPDGRELVARDADSTFSIYPIGGGAPRPIRGLHSSDTVLRWAADGRSLFVLRLELATAEVDRVDLASGARRPWRTLAPQDLAGVYSEPPHTVHLTPDGTSYVYGIGRMVSDLFLASGLQ